MKEPEQLQQMNKKDEQETATTTIKNKINKNI